MAVYDAILFDFDGVLADTEPIHYECWCEVLADFGLKMEWDFYAEKGIGVSDRELLRLVCEGSGSGITVDRLAAEYPRKKLLFRQKMSDRDVISPELRALLKELDGYKLAVVSSSGESEIEPILRAATIREHFSTAVFGNHVKRLKPAPDPYLLAIERLGVSRALVVEDSDAGIASAKAAGLDVVRVQHASETPEAVRAALGLAVPQVS